MGIYGAQISLIYRVYILNTPTTIVNINYMTHLKISTGEKSLGGTVGYTSFIGGTGPPAPFPFNSFTRGYISTISYASREYRFTFNCVCMPLLDTY